jgi:hypothetical protein
MYSTTLTISVAIAASTPIVDTAQTLCFDNSGPIDTPVPGEMFYGQDGCYEGNQPAYQDNGDGTVTDLNTELMWQQSPDFTRRYTFTEAADYANALTLGGYDDWRVPTIKELYSIVLFIGHSAPEAADSVPYLDTDYFDFEYVAESFGDRVIDMQFWSSTLYVGMVMENLEAAFGMNFADGRIKGYAANGLPNGGEFARYVRCVRGDTAYGVNAFEDVGDGTIMDHATSLQWSQADGGAMIWEEALAWCESLTLGGHDDWRLPNVKELHSIVDYSRAPHAMDPLARGPAIDPMFALSDDDGWYWSSTTMTETPPGVPAGGDGVYICFGLAWGYMCPPGQPPPCDGFGTWMDVHGAGAQRSDPKTGDPSDWPYGHGPQGDEIRIFNLVRAVRDMADPCPSDIDGSGDVGANDLLAMIAAWGPCSGCAEDITGDNDVGVNDLLILLQAWGDCF